MWKRLSSCPRSTNSRRAAHDAQQALLETQIQELEHAIQGALLDVQSAVQGDAAVEAEADVVAPPGKPLRLTEGRRPRARDWEVRRHAEAGIWAAIRRSHSPHEASRARNGVWPSRDDGPSDTVLPVPLLP